MCKELCLCVSDVVPQTESETIYWPSPSVLTARLRRLITASQRFTKSRQILQIHQTQSQPTMILSTPLYPLPSAFNDTLNPKMAAKIERQQRWEESVNVETMDYVGFFLPFVSIRARMHLY